MLSMIKGLKNHTKLLFAIPLRPVQGQRFQPTGFPNLGAATFQSVHGTSLLVESAQSMANRLEAVCWDEVNNRPVQALDGISYVRVERQEKGGEAKFLTSSMIEAHRINSPYLLENSDKKFAEKLKEELSCLTEGPIDRKLLANVLLKYDIGSLIHGVFLAKKELAGGRLRVARCLSAFIEADGIHQAISGGVKNDHVNPSGDTNKGFGNVPFPREEFTAERITLYVNLDLAQIRGYGLGHDAETLLILLALYKLRRLLEGNLRLRTACDLEAAVTEIIATRPVGFVLPGLEELENALRPAIAALQSRMTVETVMFNDALKKGKKEKKKDMDENDDTEAMGE